jgi:hypothetical protein
MNIKGHDNINLKRLDNAAYCGEMKTAIMVNGTYSFKATCKNWECKECVKGNISKIQKLLTENINGPHVFISYVEHRGKQLSNWITRHRRKDLPFFYAAIHTASGTFFISNIMFRDHPSLCRKSKSRYIDKELPESLTEHHREVTKVTHTETHEIHSDDERILLAILYDNTLAKQYKKLETNIEKAEWLVNMVNTGKGKLTKLGREFIRAHLGSQSLDDDR